jgi:hypothetical protein
MRGGIVAVLVCSVAIAFLAAVPALRTNQRRSVLRHGTLPFLEPGFTNQMGLPSVMIWAWERPDDLSLLDPQSTGVAFLAGTIYLRPASVSRTMIPTEGVLLRPRLQPLRLPLGIPLMAVVRIETPQGRSPDDNSPDGRAEATAATDSFTDDQRTAVVAMISDLASLPNVRGVQIDFDATRSEHPFYGLLLQDLRKRLPPAMPISITALASWCAGDPWLERLPPGTINEVVPMLFRMGPDAPHIVALLKNGGEFPVAACTGSLGVSTDERFSQAMLQGQPVGSAAPWGEKRIYIFSPKTWTRESTSTTIGELKKWHGESFVWR